MPDTLVSRKRICNRLELSGGHSGLDCGGQPIKEVFYRGFGDAGEQGLVHGPPNEPERWLVPSADGKLRLLGSQRSQFQFRVEHGEESFRSGRAPGDREPGSLGTHDRLSNLDLDVLGNPMAIQGKADLGHEMLAAIIRNDG